MVDEYKQQINQVWRSYIINTEETAKLLFVIRKPIRYQRAKGACHIASKRNDGGTLQASHFHTGRAESGGKDNYYPRMAPYFRAYAGAASDANAAVEID